MSFSFSRLVEMIQSFLDVYLEKNPSDFLLKVLDLPYINILSPNSLIALQKLVSREETTTWEDKIT